MHDSILNISVCLKFAPIMFNSWMIKKIKSLGIDSRVWLNNELWNIYKVLQQKYFEIFE